MLRPLSVAVFLAGSVLPVQAQQRSSFDTPSGTNQSSTARQFEGVLGVDFMISRQVGIAAEAFAATFSQGGSLTADATTIGVRFGIDAFFLR